MPRGARPDGSESAGYPQFLTCGASESGSRPRRIPVAEGGSPSLRRRAAIWMIGRMSELRNRRRHEVTGPAGAIYTEISRTWA